MKFYIASHLDNWRMVQAVGRALASRGHEITYDWTKHGSVCGTSKQRFREVAAAELEGVVAADVVIVLLPGGRGTHVEMGMAIALGKEVWLVSEWLEPFGIDEETCAFYWAPGVLHILENAEDWPQALVTEAELLRIGE